VEHEALLIACEEGDEKRVIELLASGPDTASADWEDTMALRVAAAAGHAALVRTLLTRVTVDPSGALVAAAVGNHEALVAQLLEEPRVDPSYRNGWALQVCAQHDTLTIASMLLARGVQPSSRAMRLACTYGSERVAMALLDAGAELSVRAVRLAVEANRESLCNRLLPLIQFPAARLLRVAAITGNRSLLNAIIARMGQLSDRQQAIVLCSLFDKNLAFVRALLDDGVAHVSAYGNAPLRYAIDIWHNTNGSHALIEMLLAHSQLNLVGIDKTYGFENCPPELLLRMLMHPSLEGCRDDMLLHACLEWWALSNEQRVRLLDVMSEGARREAHFLLACKKGDVEGINACLAQGVDAACHQSLALDLACRSSNAAAVALLLSQPTVDPNVRNGAPLYNAQTKEDIVKVLLSDARVDPSIGGNRALRQIANMYGGEGARALLQADARVQAVEAAGGGNEDLNDGEEPPQVGDWREDSYDDEESMI
jgi:ankyrin repeat protein